MIGVYNSITVNSKTIYRGNNFTLQREYLYAQEIETCTGKRCADLVGWRYSDLTINWDTLPESQFQDVLSLSGAEVSMVFTDETGTSVTETVVPTVITSTATRMTDPTGSVAWKNIALTLKFVNAHNS